jgi:nucleotidyltransferase/DNA polymerase involved in DNA repair
MRSDRCRARMIVEVATSGKSDDAAQRLFHLSLDEVWGIGSRRYEKLKRQGIRTIADAHQAGPAPFEKLFGKMQGRLFYEIVTGRDKARVLDPKFNSDDLIVMQRSMSAAYNGGNGGAWGAPQTPADWEEQDTADADELYRLLAEEIVPLYFERDEQGLPRKWLAVMRAAIESAVWQFSTARMLTEYVDRLYLPAVRSPEMSPA